MLIFTQEMSKTAMLKVFITIDTEVWPLLPDWRADFLYRDIQRDVYGATRFGVYGLAYQLEMLNRYGLKAVFFVEPLFAELAGENALTAIIDQIQSSGHEVQGHLHPEWLQWMSDPIVRNRSERVLLKDFAQADQETLIGKGLDNLRECGAYDICAFRAGDFAANEVTLRVLADRGVDYDTSCNHAYGDGKAVADGFPWTHQPFQTQNGYEFPVSFFCDWPGHFRHAQLCACSFGELRTALLQAWRKELYSFVLVSHSFELLKPRRANPRDPRPDWTVIRRFEKLCQFLAENDDKFQTCGFNELDWSCIPHCIPQPMLHTGPHQTAWRWIEQSVRRMV